MRDAGLPQLVTVGSWTDDGSAAANAALRGLALLCVRISTTLFHGTMKLITKTTLALSAALAMGAASACTINVNSPLSLFWEVAKQNGNVFKAKNYDRVCEVLRKNNAGISITGHAVVLDGVSIGHATISLQDVGSSYVLSSYSRTSTQVLTKIASQDRANGLFWDAVNDTLDDWDVATAVEHLNKLRATKAK